MINPLLKIALTLLCAVAYYGHYLEFRVFMATLIAVAAIDFVRPLLLRNYFMVYLYLVFIIGGGFFYPDVKEVRTDMVVYCAAFIAGYIVYRLLPKNRTVVAGISIADDNIVSLHRLILFLFLIKMILLVNDIRIYGIEEYYSGRVLTELIETYGKYDVSAGVLTIVHNVINIAGLAAIVLYVRRCLVLGKKLNYGIITLYLLVLPLLYLQRSPFAINFIMLILIYSLDKGRAMHLFRAMAIGIGAIVVIGVMIGLLRQSKLTADPNEDLARIEQAGSILMGELSPIIAYYEIKTNIDKLHYQYGSTILLPLVYKMIPRNLMPDKPINSGAYYMGVLRSDESERGFYLDTTFLGDIYLNFGYLGSIIGCCIMGLLCAGFDKKYLRGTLPYSPMYMIMFYYFYVILRSNLSNSLILILLTMAMYLLQVQIFDGTLARMVLGRQVTRGKHVPVGKTSVR